MYRERRKVLHVGDNGQMAAGDDQETVGQTRADEGPVRGHGRCDLVNREPIEHGPGRLSPLVMRRIGELQRSTP